MVEDGFYSFMMVLASFSTICQLHRGGQFYWWIEIGGPGENHRPAARH